MEKTYTKLEKVLRFVGLTLHEAEEFLTLDDASEWTTGEIALVRSFVFDTLTLHAETIWRRRICFILNHRRPTQVCAQLGVPRSTLQRWLGGVVPDVRHKRKIEQYLLDWPDPPRMQRRGWTKMDFPNPKILLGLRPWLLDDGTYRWCYAKDVPLTATRRLLVHQLKGKLEA